jgi:hypothetical protein
VRICRFSPADGALCAAAPDASAGVAAIRRGTAFIRVVGTIRAEFQRAWKEKKEKGEVEFATGLRGVAAGLPITCRHVIAGDVVTLAWATPVKATWSAAHQCLRAEGRPARFGSACWPRRGHGPRPALHQRVDLYIPLGDSDAVEWARRCALGFVRPRGRGGAPCAAEAAGGHRQRRHVSAFARSDGRVRARRMRRNPGRRRPVIDARSTRSASSR